LCVVIVDTVAVVFLAVFVVCAFLQKKPQYVGEFYILDSNYIPLL